MPVLALRLCLCWSVTSCAVPLVSVSSRLVGLLRVCRLGPPARPLCEDALIRPAAPVEREGNGQRWE